MWSQLLTLAHSRSKDSNFYYIFRLRKLLVKIRKFLICTSGLLVHLYQICWYKFRKKIFWPKLAFYTTQTLKFNKLFLVGLVRWWVGPLVGCLFGIYCNIIQSSRRLPFLYADLDFRVFVVWLMNYQVFDTHGKITIFQTRISWNRNKSANHSGASHGEWWFRFCRSIGRSCETWWYDGRWIKGL